MKAFADWDLCDLHANADMVMGKGADVGMAEPCQEQGAALHEKLLSSRLEAYFKFVCFTSYNCSDSRTPGESAEFKLSVFSSLRI